MNVFDDNLNAYVETEERLIVTHAVEQGGATTDPFISHKSKLREGDVYAPYGSVGSWSTFTLHIHVDVEHMSMLSQWKEKFECVNLN